MPPKDREQRNAYQREYMQRIRAEKRAAKEWEPEAEERLNDAIETIIALAERVETLEGLIEKLLVHVSPELVPVSPSVSPELVHAFSPVSPNGRYSVAKSMEIAAGTNEGLTENVSPGLTRTNTSRSSSSSSREEEITTTTPTTTTTNRTRAARGSTESGLPQGSTNQTYLDQVCQYESVLGEEEIKRLAKLLAQRHEQMGGVNWVKSMLRIAFKEVGDVTEDQLRTGIRLTLQGFDQQKATIRNPPAWMVKSFPSTLKGLAG
jgi:hypothetical protein